jgi:hypothetical protein
MCRARRSRSGAACARQLLRRPEVVVCMQGLGGQLAGAFIEHEFQAADVTAIHNPQAGLAFDLVMVDMTPARRAFPGHGLGARRDATASVAMRNVLRTDCTRTTVASFPSALPLRHFRCADTSDRVAAVWNASDLRFASAPRRSDSFRKGQKRSKKGCVSMRESMRIVTNIRGIPNSRTRPTPCRVAVDVSEERHCSIVTL